MCQVFAIVAFTVPGSERFRFYTLAIVPLDIIRACRRQLPLSR